MFSLSTESPLSKIPVSLSQSDFELHVLVLPRSQREQDFAARMMLQVRQPKLSHSWWFQSHKSSPRSSPWLASTLQDLDEKTKMMLKLIEQDADSFAQRAEMYYKKRPELVNIVEDFYRAHRSLAERFDLLRSEKSKNCKNASDKEIRVSSNCFESEDSDVEDPDQEEDDDIGGEKLKLMDEELRRLREENSDLKAQLLAKDEEKREVIRQLSLSINILKEENQEMRKCLKESKKWNPFELMMPGEGLFKGMFLGRFF